MKKILVISAGCFTLLLNTANSQGKNAVSFSDLSPAALSAKLTEKCLTDREKVTTIFVWITDNISYNVRVINKNKNVLLFEEPDDSSKTLTPLDERISRIVLKRRTAVCDGYSRLFKVLCNYAGVRSEIITGYARGGWDNSKSRFKSNHKWNAVFIDSAWFLLDVTWASGYITRNGNEFVRQYDSRYYLSSPEQFIRDHYPEDMNWTLLQDPPTLSEFHYMPYHYMAFIRSGVVSYFPVKGVVNASVGDSIRFEIETVGNRIDMYVSDTPAVETDYDYKLPLPAGHKTVYKYGVSANSPEWLYIICNGETILRYRLNIKKPDNRTAVLSSK